MAVASAWRSASANAYVSVCNGRRFAPPACRALLRKAGRLIFFSSGTKKSHKAAADCDKQLRSPARPIDRVARRSSDPAGTPQAASQQGGGPGKACARTWIPGARPLAAGACSFRPPGRAPFGTEKNDLKPDGEAGVA